MGENEYRGSCEYNRYDRREGHSICMCLESEMYDMIITACDEGCEDWKEN